MQERQEGSSILEAIGSEQFKRLGVSDAADIMTKVTGTTVVEGKFAVIRGLGDRYNLTLLNGAEVPTADPYRRAAQLDMIPAGMIDRMLISKTFTPDLPGGFAGGAANIVTRSFPEVCSQRFPGRRIQHPATGNPDYLVYKGGATDWAGFDDGTRGAARRAEVGDRSGSGGAGARGARDTRPGSDPPATGGSRAVVPERLLRLPVRGYPAGATAGPLGLAVGGGTRELGTGRLGYLTSVTYARRFNFYDNGYSAKYRNADIDTEPGPESCSDTRAITEVNWSGVVAIGVPAQRRPRVRLQLHLQPRVGGSGEAHGRHAARKLRPGPHRGPRDAPVDGARPAEFPDARAARLRTMVGHMHADWLVFLAGTGQDKPDQRFFNYARDPDFTDNEVQNNSLPEPSVPSRNFRALEESNLTARFDDTIQFGSSTVWSPCSAWASPGGDVGAHLLPEVVPVRAGHPADRGFVGNRGRSQHLLHAVEPALHHRGERPWRHELRVPAPVPHPAVRRFRVRGRAGDHRRVLPGGAADHGVGQGDRRTPARKTPISNSIRGPTGATPTR